MTALKVLVDVGVGIAVEDWFRQNGHDTVAVRDRDPHMDDTDILAWAVAEARLVVTMDKDFGELVFHSGQQHAGVLLLRMEGAVATEKVRVVKEIVKNHGDELAGKFAVYHNGHLRIRP
jgi:predicted nuclease of predicted toxin-antitoxin system